MRDGGDKEHCGHATVQNCCPITCKFNHADTPNGGTQESGFTWISHALGEGGQQRAWLLFLIDSAYITARKSIPGLLLVTMSLYDILCLFAFCS